MLTGLGCHTLSAVRELVGLPLEVKSVAVDGEHLVVVFQFGGFLATYEIVNDQDIVQFDAAIEIYQHNRYLHVKHEPPYLRYQPHNFTVVESSKTDTRTTTYGPDYRDSFENELKYFRECVETGRKPKTSFEDSMQDLILFKQICDKI
jgi:predicted dehydrogenase